MSLLDALFQPCAKTTGYVPQTPEAYHSLVYTLTYALAQFNLPKYDDKDNISNGHNMELSEQVRSSILTILDDLVNGSLIPVMGSAWKSYHSQSATKIPNAVARFCVIEALLKTLMMGNCNQTNPYHGVATTTNTTERFRDQLILEELLPRYWKEPGVDERPAYFKIIFLLTELSCETFLMSSVEDLKIKTSVASSLIRLVVDKLSPAKLQYYLADRDTVEIQKMVAFNVIVMLLSLLSICSFQEQPLQQPSSAFSSPKLSPQPSMPDFSSIATSVSTTDISHDHQSISSFNIHIASDAAMRKLLLTLKSYIEEFWNSGYKDLILAGTESMHQDTSGERSARCFQNLSFHINPTIGEEIVKKTLPSLFKRLVDTYPPAIPSICQMLHEISKRYRSSFFKPVVSCVASDDEDKVSTMLNLITCLRRYMSGVQFWMQDAEMINVLLLSDVGQSKKNKESTSSKPQLKTSDSEWGSTTLGQCVIATEFMWAIKEMREKQRDPHRNMEEDEIAKKFLIDLERRLSVFLTAKEKMALVPMPLRVILCNIFMDMRFFCNTTHRPGWLTRVIDWATQPVVSTSEHVFHHVLPIINPVESPTPNNPPNQSKMAVLHTGHLEEVMIMFERLNGVYLNVVDSLQYETNDSSNFAGSVPKSTQPGVENRFSEVPRHKRQQLIHRMYPISRSAALSLDLNPPVSADNGSGIVEAPASKLAKYRFENMEKINQDPFGSVFSLLAAVFTTLSSHEFGKLVRPLWERHVDDRKSQSFIPAVFLLMECGEKIPKVMIEVCTHDFYR